MQGQIKERICDYSRNGRLRRPTLVNGHVMGPILTGLFLDQIVNFYIDKTFQCIFLTMFDVEYLKMIFPNEIFFIGCEIVGKIIQIVCEIFGSSKILNIYERLWWSYCWIICRSWKIGAKKCFPYSKSYIFHILFQNCSKSFFIITYIFLT